MQNVFYQLFRLIAYIFVIIFLVAINAVLVNALYEKYNDWKETKNCKQKINESITNYTLPHTERNVNIMLKDVIKEEREKQDLSLSELARRCGHAVSTLHAIESGDNSNPSYRTIADICAALGLSLDELEQRIQKNKSDKLSQ